ncbi:MAG: deoxyribodipyrimidine photo-lyase, partial [Pseudomonadota bacterium]|nr:deoxyribodipyrimidine photo-lyase [Pseudomonadota bacterium]
MSIDFPADAPALFWFRRDLRLADNPGLTAALETGRPLICVHVDDPELSASADGAAPVDAWRA